MQGVNDFIGRPRAGSTVGVLSHAERRAGWLSGSSGRGDSCAPGGRGRGDRCDPDCRGSGSYTDVTADQTGQDYTATQDEYTLTVNSAHGAVTKSPDKATYHYGDVVTLGMTADPGWTFTGWTPSLPLDQVTITGDTTVTANFLLLPGAFNKIAPANGATNQSVTPTLSWGASSGAASYWYCIGTTASYCDTHWIDNSTATSVVLPTLSPGTKYYWHVRAVNAGGTTYSNATSTIARTFTTIP